MKVHKVKCWTSYFEAIVAGEKNFDVRRDDRGYQKGDLIKLEQYDPKHCRYVTDPDDGIPYSIEKEIKYILTGGQFGIEPGFVVLGF